MHGPGSQLEHKRRILPGVRRVVVKIGSGVLSTALGLRRERIEALARDLDEVSRRPRELIVVTSGAVASGRGRLRLQDRPMSVRMKQAVAAVGQIDLMASYERAFAAHGRDVGQILLTRDDFSDRARYLNAAHTLTTLLELGIIPIINENDSVAVDEVKFGDNDQLSALTATLANADLLIVLSDVAGLYAEDPRTHADAALIPLVAEIDEETRRRAGQLPGTMGTGGMSTKLDAAAVATRAGIPTIVADGARERVVQAILDPDTEVGTLFLATGDRLARRKHWIAYTLKPAGSLTVDEGARVAIVAGGRSLLASGLRSVDGRFDAGDCVRCLDPAGVELARGLVNYSDIELRKIIGVQSREIEKHLGYRISDEVIHRDDLVVLDLGARAPSSDE
jgi:glutamate 5-kinase